MNGLAFDPYKIPLVSLAPISDEQQTDSNLEPPFVRVRSGNSSFLHLDGGSKDRNSDLNNSVFTIGTQENRLYTRKIQRFSLAGVQLGLNTPNINPRNNVVIFESSPGVIHTSSIPEGYYESLDTAIAGSALTALETALNSATPASGITFTVSWPRSTNPVASKFQGLITATAPFRFFEDPSNLMLVKGATLFNLPRDQNFTVSKTLGAAFLVYSRYIDVCSYALTQYSKNPTSSNQGPSNLYARFFLTPAFNTHAISSTELDFAILPPSTEATNFNRSRAFEKVDITLRDEFGDLFYIPSIATNTPANVGPSLVLLTEV
jgi:hypothetical protein